MVFSLTISTLLVSTIPTNLSARGACYATPTESCPYVELTITTAWWHLSFALEMVVNHILPILLLKYLPLLSPNSGGLQGPFWGRAFQTICPCLPPWQTAFAVAKFIACGSQGALCSLQSDCFCTCFSVP